MQAVAERVTLAEFDSRFAEEKPYYEYWLGFLILREPWRWLSRFYLLAIAATRLRQKCEAYAKWGFEQLYVIDPERGQLFEWRNGLVETDNFAGGIPASEIWRRLNRDLG